MQIDQIEKRITKIKKQLQEIKEMRPGSLSKQYNVCGKAGCKCKNKIEPQKHGPYYQLSYGYKGRSTSQFIRQNMLIEIKKQMATYKLFKTLTEEWVDLAIEHSKLQLEIAKHSGIKKMR